MPLFGIGTSESRTDTTNNTDYDVSDERIGASGGGIAVRDGTSTVTTIATSTEAVELGEAYADVANEIADGAFDLGRDGISAAEQALDQMGYFGNRAFGLVRDSNEESLDFGRFTVAEAFDFARRSQQDADDVVQRSQTMQSETANAVIAAAAEDTTELSSQIIRIGIPAIAVIAIAWSLNR